MLQGVARPLPLSVRWRTKLRQWAADFTAFWNRHPIDRFWPPHP
jgi:hypothetical protein